MWDFIHLSSILPTDIIQKLMSVMPPCENVGRDVMTWKANWNGWFSIKRVYFLIEKCPENLYNSLFKVIWKWRGAERIKVFVWLVHQNKLPTNQWRSRWSSQSFSAIGVTIVLKMFSTS